jgi:hypothetical protein
MRGDDNGVCGDSRSTTRKASGVLGHSQRLCAPRDQSGAMICLFEIQMTVHNRNFLFARCDRTWADLFSTHEAPTKEELGSRHRNKDIATKDKSVAGKK